ncbi:hypothetical protein NM688_g1336 [Phlebia brevispora]|uniref:Uncharacterized protein n=1 Tax=Phlebia brevispora TaxID=194682 RepID=A0ACC1TBY3_9APHY|nr:hypothetical protein NM688_g1336 [Phlebia brevispora]
MDSCAAERSHSDIPWGLKWRSSVWYITFIVGLGVTVDLLVYSIVIPVLPFRLEDLGYSGVSALVGWLLFGYSGGLVVSTPPIAALSEKYQNRKYPLIAGQIILIASQILLMEAPKYWVMILARVIQGISSSMIWVVGLALICDSVPENVVGRQLGIAMTGLSLGILIGPPVGGGLYTRFGFRGPFIFAIILTAADLIGRILIIERPEALRYLSGSHNFEAADQAQRHLAGGEKTTEAIEMQLVAKDSEQATTDVQADLQPDVTSNVAGPIATLSLWAVFRKLMGSPRAVTVLLATLIYGIVYSSQEPAVPLYLQALWGLNSSKVGLIYLAAVIPTLFSSPLAGWWADRKGTEWITVASFVSSIPWWVLITIHSSLAFFIVMFAFESFFTSAVVSPLTAELAAVSRAHAGVGYAHVYGAFNLSYGIGATIGPIIGGQMYDHIKHGWTAICLLATGLLAVSSVMAICFTGAYPLLQRL